MSRPKINWNLETKKFKQLFNSATKEIAELNKNFIELEKNFEKAKKIWYDREDRILRKISEREQEINKLTRVISNLHEVISVLGEEITERPFTDPPYNQMLRFSSPNNFSDFSTPQFQGANFLMDEHAPKDSVGGALGNKEDMIGEIKANAKAKLRKRRTNKSST